MQLYAGHVSVDSQPCCSYLGDGSGLSFHGVIDGQGLGVGVRDHSRLCGAGNTPMSPLLMVRHPDSEMTRA